MKKILAILFFSSVAFAVVDPAPVTVTNTDPIPVSGSFSLGSSPIPISASSPIPVFQSSQPLPANAAQETGGNLAAIAASLAGTINAFVSGSVSVSNFPTSFAVTAASPLPVAVSGSVSVTGAFPTPYPSPTVLIGNPSVLPTPYAIQTIAAPSPIQVTGPFPTPFGSPTVLISGTVPVSGTFWQATQPVSGTVAVTGAPTPAPQIKIWDSTNFANVTSSNALKVDGSAVTQPVSIAATVNVAGAFPTPYPSPTVLISGTVPVSGTFWQATQPVSGTFFQTTQPVSIAAAVATNADSSTNGTASATSHQASAIYFSATPTPTPGKAYPLSLDANANLYVKVANTSLAVTGAFPTPYPSPTVLISGTVPVSGTFWQATQPVSGTVAVTGAPTPAPAIRIWDSTNYVTVTGSNALKVDNSAVTQPISASALPLPSGAATSSNQTTELSSLSSIDGKLIQSFYWDATNKGINVFDKNSNDRTTLSTTINSSTAVSYDVQDMGCVVLQVVGGTLSATLSFEENLTGSTADDIIINCTDIGSGSYQSTSGAVVSSNNSAWACPVYAAKKFVINPTVFSGSGTVHVNVNRNFCGQVYPALSNTLGATYVTPSGGSFNVNIHSAGGTNINMGQQDNAGSLPVILSTAQTNVPTNLAAVNGTTATGGAGNATSGSQRIVLATDNRGPVEIWDGTNTATVTAGKLNVALASNQSTNVAQVNGVTTSTGIGVSDTGTQRVNLASDSQGSIRVWDGTNRMSVSAAGALTVLGSGNFTVAQATGTNLHAVLDTTSTTACTQATGSNLHMVADASSAVIGHVINDASSAVIGHVINDSGNIRVWDATNYMPMMDADARHGFVTIAAAATNIAKAEDSASADADVGVPAMAIQKTTPADTAGTDGDYVMLQMSGGRLWSTANIDKFGGTAISTGTGAGGAGIPRVTISSDSSLAANQSVNISQMNGVTTLMDNGATGTGAQRVTVSNNSLGTFRMWDGTNIATVTAANALKVDGSAVTQPVSFTPPTLTKGTQGATGYSIQQLHDAGRTHINFYANGAASGTTTTETAITLTKSSGTSATTTGTSFTCTSGKTYRITSLTFGTRGNATGTAEITVFSLRINTAGAVITSSTPIVLKSSSGAAATALAYDRINVNLGGDGYEIVCDGTLQFGVTANSTFTTNAPTWDVLITGYEY